VERDVENVGRGEVLRTFAGPKQALRAGANATRSRRPYQRSVLPKARPSAQNERFAGVS
jgi:hypothetical protein